MIKVGIVGAGFMGAMHAECYKNLSNAKLEAIADTDLTKAENLAKKYEAKAYQRTEDLFKEKDIGIVDICLPTFLHKECAVKAAGAGKNILCEKPIALTVEDADEMIEVAGKAGVKFMIAQVLRFWPEYIKLKDIFDKRELGDLLSITCTRLSMTPNWAWDNWLTDSKRSGGALVDLHIHDTDFLLCLIGKPLGIFSRMPKSSLEYGHIFTTYTFPKEIAAFAEGGWDMPDNFPLTMSFTANFEKGTVEFNSRWEKSLAVYKPGEEVEYPEVKVELQASAETGGNISDLGGYFSEIRYFVDCVENDKMPTLATGESARDSLKVVLAEKRSIETGNLIRFS